MLPNNQAITHANKILNVNISLQKDAAISHYVSKLYSRNERSLHPARADKCINITRTYTACKNKDYTSEIQCLDCSKAFLAPLPRKCVVFCEWQLRIFNLVIREGHTLKMT
ncbi:hypothetical protein PR048_003593 [Dryococelus australis]|uniref:Uncharacterized protein n=1 Tax=Dryococelus australis TaxID=614101 RepID=A0ABQ9INH1_9NEOP|nr:hypothetical protein PR048_003593 [Dryococelus australis]